MPTTRAKTGKLPGKVDRLGTVASGATIGSRAGAKRSSLSAKIVARKKAKGENAESSTRPTLPIFQTFATNTNLQDGICIIRTLEDGSYEVVNLSQIGHTALTSEETGRQIAQLQGRVKAMSVSEQEWAAISYKVEQAVSAANLKIFRLEKLPTELRYRIYEFALIGKRPLKNFKRGVSGNFKSLATALLETCKWVYHEARPIFWKNSLEVTSLKIFSAPMVNIIKDNLQNVTFSWLGYKRQDKNAMKFFATCPNLRILNILLCKFTFNNPYPRRQPPGYEKYVEPICKFSKINGFDAMLDLRGLDRVNVRRDEVEPPLSPGVTDDELDTFEEFLNLVLTKPKPAARLPKKTRTQIREAAKLAKVEQMFRDKPRLPSRFGRGAAIAAGVRVAQQLNQADDDGDEKDDD